MVLTVIVTVFNIAEHLPRFFDSMSKQTFGDYCLLMIDDGSEDDGFDVCRKYAEKDSRIKVVSLKHVGIAEARNIAMEYIESEFAAYADGDDYVEPGYLQHLMDAQKKYDADLVISRVAYHLEKDNILEGSFPERGELFIEKNEFSQKLPMLLDDRRLNYLYGKVYRTKLLKDIRVESDVRQGSDTMINCQYIKNAKSIVLIDDLDYHYIRYSGRSVTSYSGKDAFERICRINSFVFDEMEKQGLLTDKMVEELDKRVLLSAIWVIDKIMASGAAKDVKAEQITKILNKGLYITAYQRQKGNSDLKFEPIKPQNGTKYMNANEKRLKINQRKSKILEKCPKFIVDLYHAVKPKG
ncbi:MAG: glycosyltransferase family 2 protein [Clostridia bacterium]|nr:glycosyltransferase family 2 protein [Clostridia bacterium]